MNKCTGKKKQHHRKKVMKKKTMSKKKCKRKKQHKLDDLDRCPSCSAFLARFIQINYDE